MTFFDLTWYQRMVLWNRIGSAPVPSIKEADTYLRIISKIRPTDEEQRDAQLTAVGGGYVWKPTESGWGDRSVELEDEEAKALVACLSTAQPGQVISVRDAEWMIPLIKQIEAQIKTEEKATA